MRGAQHYARTAHLRSLFAKHHTHRQAYRFHRGAALGGLIMMAVGTSGPQWTAWATIGAVALFGCGARALYAFGALPVGDRRRT